LVLTLRITRRWGWRMRSLPGALLYLPLLLLSAVHLADAQPAPAPPAPAVRYQFGDDQDGSKRWANVNLDDSSGPVAPKDMWPRPPFYSDGFVWIRFRVPVRTDTMEPLALRVSSVRNTLIAYEVFVNSTRVGSFGRVSPRPTAESLPREASLQLAAGDTLTFLSDGVAEAQNAQGELFGFDRTRALSTHSADEIARAAQDFGQQDDITVLTLTFSPAEVTHA